MLRRYWIWGTILVASSVLVTGCGSAPGRKSTPSEGQRTVSVKRERVAEQSAERLAKAHAHYSAAVLHDINAEPRAAAEEYYQAALLDPDDRDLILEASRRLLQILSLIHI